MEDVYAGANSTGMPPLQNAHVDSQHILHDHVEVIIGEFQLHTAWRVGERGQDR